MAMSLHMSETQLWMKRMIPLIKQKLPGQNWSLSVGSGIFFICAFLYLWLFVDMGLIYHSYGTTLAYPAFQTGGLFFKTSLSHPGGLVEYVAGFLSHLYYFPWLGALIAAGVAWLAYCTSKRLGGFFTRTYFSYIDESGKAYKPFILPQKDPLYYDSLLQTYSVPELIKSPVKVSQISLARAVRGTEKIEIDGLSSATKKAEDSAWKYVRE